MDIENVHLLPVEPTKQPEDQLLEDIVTLSLSGFTSTLLGSLMVGYGVFSEFPLFGRIAPIGLSSMVIGLGVYCTWKTYARTKNFFDDPNKDDGARDDLPCQNAEVIELHSTYSKAV